MSLRRIVLYALLAGLALGYAAEVFGRSGVPIGMAATFLSVLVLGLLTPAKKRS